VALSHSLRTFLISSAVLALGACAGNGRNAACVEESLLTAWKADWIRATWTFEPDGRLACEGVCDYGPGFGEPVSWAPEPTANLWASGLDYIKLTFSEVVLDGTVGGLRCRTEDFGNRLVLEPLSGIDLTFTRRNRSLPKKSSPARQARRRPSPRPRYGARKAPV
jgi:hypothetical protein